jgi:uncharacterized LabA/DUF88 family protein
MISALLKNYRVTANDKLALAEEAMRVDTPKNITLRKFHKNGRVRILVITIPRNGADCTATPTIVCRCLFSADLFGGRTMERTAIFLDIANLEQQFRKLNTHIDYLGLRDYLAEGRSLVETFVYFPINPYYPERKKKFADFLRKNGFFVRSKVGKPRPNNKWKCNFDVEMAVDILHYAHHGRVDIIVIGSGDGDMLSICKAVRRTGVRCEVAATKESTAEELVGAANGYIDLGSVIREQRGQIIWNDSEGTNPIAPEVKETNSVL